MRDEEYVYYQDVREKKVTGYSARKQRSHCGKSGRVRLPSDYLTKKEIKNMSGECKSYRLNEPMKWAEFKAMPDDIKIIYINAIREKYNAPNTAICNMMGCTKDALYFQLKRLDLAHGTKGPKKWDAAGFFSWWKGIPTKEELVAEVEEQPAEQEVIEEDVNAINPIETEEEIAAMKKAEAERFKEEEIRFKKVIPTTGSMTYEGMTFDILSSISDLLGNAKVLLSVKWDVVTD